MDDEEFILVSKNKIKDYETKISKLEEENKRLKEIHSNASTQKDKSTKPKKEDDFKQLKTFISKKHTELQKEIQIKLEELSNLKDLPTNINKEISKELKSQQTKSSDNEISKQLEHISNSTNKIHNDMREYNSQIISNVKLLVEHLQDSKAIEEVQSSINEIKSQFNEHFTATQGISDEVESSETELQIFEKLQEIELFMANLRTLLSYVKPKYIEREQ